MSTLPKPIADLRQYVENVGFSLSDLAESVFVEAESIGSRLNVNLFTPVFLAALIERVPKLRAVMMRRNLSPEESISVIEEAISEMDYDPYADAYCYSTGAGASRQAIIDNAMDAARSKRRTQIEATDVLEAVMDLHDDVYPVIENGEWGNSRLRVEFNTLSHVTGGFHRSLWLSFDDIRRELDLFSLSAARRIPVRRAPHRLRSAVLSLLADHPDYRANCFIIMPFHRTSFHGRVVESLRKILRELHMNPLRADDRSYSQDILANIEAYLYGCRFAVAVHDRHSGNAHNANVALEVGYCLGMKKPVCLLKEHTVEGLPSDLQGRIYLSFDGERMEESLRAALLKWLSDNGILTSDSSPTDER